MLIRPKTPNGIEVQLVNWIAGLVESNIDLANVLVDCGILTGLRWQRG